MQLFEKEDKTKNRTLDYFTAYTRRDILFMHLSIYSYIGNLFIYSENEYGGKLFADFDDHNIRSYNKRYYYRIDCANYKNNDDVTFV